MFTAGCGVSFAQLQPNQSFWAVGWTVSPTVLNVLCRELVLLAVLTLPTHSWHCCGKQGCGHLPLDGELDINPSLVRGYDVQN